LSGINASSGSSSSSSSDQTSGDGTFSDQVLIDDGSNPYNHTSIEETEISSHSYDEQNELRSIDSHWRNSGRDNAFIIYDSSEKDISGYVKGFSGNIGIDSFFQIESSSSLDLAVDGITTRAKLYGKPIKYLVLMDHGAPNSNKLTWGSKSILANDPIWDKIGNIMAPDGVLILNICFAGDSPLPDMIANRINRRVLSSRIKVHRGKSLSPNVWRLSSPNK